MVGRRGITGPLLAFWLVRCLQHSHIGGEEMQEMELRALVLVRRISNLDDALQAG